MNNTISVGNAFPLLPEGEYEVCYVYHETWNYMGRNPKVAFWFRVINIGEYFGTLIPRYFNVKQLKGKPAKNGRFVPGRSSDFLLEYCNLFPRRITRLDRIPLSLLENEIIKVQVKTVTKNREQRSMPEVLQYSVIKHWLAVVSR